MLSENASFLCNLFSKLLETDNSIRESAENQINQLIQYDRIEFIQNCSAIIMDDGIARNIVFFAIQNITLALTPYNVSINNVREYWMNADPEIRSYIKTAVFRGLMFQEENISNMTSKAICVLALIEREEFFPVIEKIIMVSGDDEQSNNADFQSERFSLSALYVLKEILSPPYYFNHINDIPNLKQLIQNMNAQIFDYFAKKAPFKSDKYKEMVASVLNSLILCASPLYQNNEVIQALLPLINNYFLSNPTDNLYETLFQILFNLTTINYSKKKFDFISIYNITTNQIANQANPSHLSIAIYFWTCISKFEINLLQKVIKYKRLLEARNLKCFNEEPPEVNLPIPQAVNNFTKLAATELSEKLFSILTFIDQNNLSSESKDAPREPHMFSTVCLSKFFKLNHRIIFESVRNFWMTTISTYHPPENNSKYNLLYDEKVPWSVKHALLLSISIICTDMDNYKFFNADYFSSNNDDKLLSKMDYDQIIVCDIINFLTDEITPGFRIFYDFLLQSILSPIPRIIDTALYTIKMCVQYYDIGINVDDPQSSPFTFLMTSFKKMMAETKYDETIFERILHILSIYIMKFSKERKFSLIMNFQDDILSLIAFGLTPPLNSYDIYILTNKILKILIIYTPPQEENLVLKIFDITMNSLIDLMKFNSDETIVKQQRTLNIINVILKLEYIKITEEQLFNSARIFFQFMERKNSVFEDALRCLIAIIHKLGTSSNQLTDKIIRFIPDALSSHNPSIITITTVAIVNIYKENSFDPDKNRYLPQNLIESLPNTVEMIISLLNESSFNRDFIPNLLYELANLIDAACYHIPIIKADEIKGIYFKYVDLPLNLSNEYDVEFGNNLYGSIFAGLSSLIKIYDCYDDKAQMMLKNKKNAREFMDAPIRHYLLFNEYSDESLTNYCDYLHTLHHFFGNVISALINRKTNFKPLLFACASDKQELQKKGTDIVLEIKRA